MSARSRVLFERGRFFIETGTATFIKQWLQQNRRALAAIPEEVISRLEYFVTIGDKDSAANLWLHMCKIADTARIRLLWSLASYLFHAALAGGLVYCLVRVINHY